ncbi:MAG: hypothetical protein ABIN91_04545 [Mucilaginibacter sp.]|uniref:hypothetical protein n=1 Tax=Mucilaginibacter sp. TaxID=1882438 RepID=UPI003265C932
MFLKADKQHQYILIFILLFTLVAGIMIVICPPALFPDPSWGFQVMRSMQMGGGFNQLITPSQSNLNNDNIAFLTWWSPGQYLIPYLFSSLFHTNAGQSGALTILLCDVLGILGFYSFFKKVGFSPMVSALSVLLIASQQFYFIPFAFYNGGETLLFGFLGWFLYGCFSFKKINWQLFVFVILTGWVGFICKSAYLWMYASGMACLWINLSFDKKEISSWVKNGIILSIPFLISLGSIFKLFILRGTNPASVSPGFKLSLEALCFPLASPLLSGFSVDELTHGLICHQDEPYFNATQTLFVLALLALLSVGLFWAIIRFVPKPQYKIAISMFYGVSTLFFLSVFLRQLDISYEGRHFRIVGLLFIPGTVYLFSQLKPFFKYAFIALWICVAFTSFKYFVNSYNANTHINAHGTSGFSQQFIDQQALDHLQQLDKTAPPNALFAFISNDLGLDILHHRIISMDAFEEGAAATYIANNEYDGHSGPLYILLPQAFVKNKNVEAFKVCFKGYKNFTIKPISKGYVLLCGE